MLPKLKLLGALKRGVETCDSCCVLLSAHASTSCPSMSSDRRLITNRLMRIDGCESWSVQYVVD